MTTRLSFFLLMVALGIITLAPQGSARKISAVRIPDPRDFFRGSPPRDKSILWRANLALQLVRRPELKEHQARIILEAISLSTPDFFAASDDTYTKKVKADHALQLLTQRAVAAFPRSEAAELFANIGFGKAEEAMLKAYYDVSALPLTERKASFRSASSNYKSVLWRTHLALFLVKRPELNERQKNIIWSAMSLATPERFGIRSSDSTWKTNAQDSLRSLEEQIVVAFSLEDAKIFTKLGDDTESRNHSVTDTSSVLLKSINYDPLSNSVPYQQWTDGRIGGQGKDNDKKDKDKKDSDKNKDKGASMELERSPCQCSTESDWCPLYSSCTGSNCNATQSGCGTLWLYPCNGVECKGSV